MKRFYFLGFMLLVVAGCSSATSPRGAKDMAMYDRAATAYKNGELSEAETLYRKLVARHAEYGEGWFKLGNIYVRMGQYDAAANMYKKAAQINPEDGKIWNNLALAHVKKAVAILDEGTRHAQQASQEQRSMQQLRERIVQSVLAE
jgi:Tfp pilus assembly protein PilF